MPDQAPGGASDFETRIDQAPAIPKQADPWRPLLSFVEAAHVNGVLVCESSALPASEAFAQFDSAVVLSSDQDWNPEQFKSMLALTLEPQITTAKLGLVWTDRHGYSEFDGLLPLALQISGKYLILSNDPQTLRAVVNRLGQKSNPTEPSIYASGFNHTQEVSNFRRVTTFIDRAGLRGSAADSNGANQPRQPAFFSGNVASFGDIFSAIASESIVVRNAGHNVTQTVTYQWK
jgi:hypothetical protein